MIAFRLNTEEIQYNGNVERTLLDFLREDKNITSVKDGCSGQGVCGACLVEINGKAKLSCKTKLKVLNGGEIITLEGVPENVRLILAKSFVKKGAVQCGFCTPGIIMRTKILFDQNPIPSRDEIKKALNLNLCRCTGYKKIIEAIELASVTLAEKKDLILPVEKAGVGLSVPKIDAIMTALGQRHFVSDIRIEGMLFAALRFSDHPRAKVKFIDGSKAMNLHGVVRIFTAGDIPGHHNSGLIFKDWPLMIGLNETTSFIGDVIAGVVAVSCDIAKQAAGLIEIEYEVYTPVTEMLEAVKKNAPQVHPGRSNILEKCTVRRGGNVDQIISESEFVSKGIYTTQRIEHAFLETEAAIAVPVGKDGLEMFVNSQGIYVDRRQVADLLSIPEEKINIKLIATGGGFGGKEDMTVQGHAALFAWLLKKPVKLVLTREESIRMHPKRHPVQMEIAVAADKNGKLTAVKLYAVGDTGAYASVGTKVMERVVGHATGGYHVPAVDLVAITAYTNNIPSGAMRGFGVPQVVFALEGCIDEICEQGGFDRWKFRYDNALVNGSTTATGQILEKGVGIRATLEAVKEEFYNAKFAGLACGIKNVGVGNGMPDFSDIKILIKSENEIEIQHGWTEMGQGVDTVVLQIFCQETGIDPSNVKVNVETKSGLPTGMTTSSRATVLVGNAVIDGSKKLTADLKTKSLRDLGGKVYTGRYFCDWTTKPGTENEKIVTHFAYGYATQLVVLNETGEVEKVIAAHDAGRIINPALFEGQIEGAVHMGLGYALTEDLPMKDGFLVSTELRDLGIIRAKDMPEVVVKGVEVSDPVGPYGAKGIGEIGLVPTAAAVANALCRFDKKRRYSLPMKRSIKKSK
jgi:selenium-dependent xanthine dehydrogenase